MQFLFKSVLLRGGTRPRPFKKNPFFALAIAIAAVAAAAAAILRILTFEASLFLLDLFIKRLLILTTVKALKCIKCINNKIISRFNKDYYNCDTSVIRCLRCAKSSYSNCTAAFAAANTAFDNFLALDAALLRSAASSPSGLANGSRGFKSSPDGLAGFAFALKTFNLNIAFIKLNSFIAVNRSPVTRSASGISLFPLALALAALIALVASAASVALIIVALFALIVALAAFTAAPAVAITLAKRRAKYMRAIKASRLTRERLINLKA
ncbi:hypothetical protein MBM_08378 [Drepanopeziza brunnea f. sp. 'multigermtubi' MB_m1]|uniref:Uncharacterized protein n=1 Tax=Marssonina brunnea f. sp. multigermtubi (strain MB_m1) TaxID=1072389 RepID=K1W905_MARBU|nr:uncharacterized protein MBM_08378 [Drepanopeziza brunnea f. sp. 'multigermtubi' MB_m1]EKD13660.1 hypothetical protein MBM_08378 [Drepanopeziza brunnea f. sp. 'multigermtubi' MB_m1]